MKRSLPVVLKYLAVVGISCFLAFVISQTLASALEAPQSAYTRSESRNASTSGQAGYASRGAYKIEISLSSWRDAARMREIPVKLYFPVIVPGGTAVTKFPVILFSHGLGGSREGGNRWAEHWASHGFVVVAMQHPGSDESLWKGASARDFASKMKAGMTYANLVLRINDVHFVIDEVIRRTEARDSAFANAEPKRIGMSGHSFGAQTTLVVAGQKLPMPDAESAMDLRITAAIAFSPNARNKSALSSQFGGIKLAFFSVTGSDDGSILDDGTKPEFRRLPYENMPAGQKYLVVFDGGDHMVFGGHGFGQRRPETLRDKKIQTDVMAGTLAFWNTYLKQDAVARSWLEQGAYQVALGTRDIFEHK